MFEEFNSIIDDALNNRPYKSVEIKRSEPAPKSKDVDMIVPVYWSQDPATGVWYREPTRLPHSLEFNQKIARLENLMARLVVCRRSINDTTNELVDILINGATPA